MPEQLADSIDIGTMFQCQCPEGVPRNVEVQVLVDSRVLGPCLQVACQRVQRTDVENKPFLLGFRQKAPGVLGNWHTHDFLRLLHPEYDHTVLDILPAQRLDVRVSQAGETTEQEWFLDVLRRLRRDHCFQLFERQVIDCRRYLLRHDSVQVRHARQHPVDVCVVQACLQQHRVQPGRIYGQILFVGEVVGKLQDKVSIDFCERDVWPERFQMIYHICIIAAAAGNLDGVGLLLEIIDGQNILDFLRHGHVQLAGIQFANPSVFDLRRQSKRLAIFYLVGGGLDGHQVKLQEFPDALAADPVVEVQRESTALARPLVDVNFFLDFHFPSVQKVTIFGK